MPAKKEKHIMTFDEALKKLEEIANELENNDISLEKSIEYLKQAAELKGICEKTLKEAKIKIEIFNKDGSLNAIDEEMF